MGVAAVGNQGFFNIQVPALIFAGAAAVLLLLHEFPDVLEVVLSELVPIHRHIHIQLLYLGEDLGELVLPLWLGNH